MIGDSLDNNLDRLSLSEFNEIFDSSNSEILSEQVGGCIVQYGQDSEINCVNIHSVFQVHANVRDLQTIDLQILVDLIEFVKFWERQVVRTAKSYQKLHREFCLDGGKEFFGIFFVDISFHESKDNQRLDFSGRNLVEILSEIVGEICFHVFSFHNEVSSLSGGIFESEVVKSRMFDDSDLGLLDLLL